VGGDVIGGAVSGGFGPQKQPDVITIVTITIKTKKFLGVNLDLKRDG
jgi:hypothetical protein